MIRTMVNHINYAFEIVQQKNKIKNVVQAQLASQEITFQEIISSMIF
jgi:hypothetical protein